MKTNIYFWLDGATLEAKDLFPDEVVNSLTLIELQLMRYELLIRPEDFKTTEDFMDTLEDLCGNNIAMQNTLIKRIEGYNE